jgi:hypothetical protein
VKVVRSRNASDSALNLHYAGLKEVVRIVRSVGVPRHEVFLECVLVEFDQNSELDPGER